MTGYPIPANYGHWWLATSRRLHAVTEDALTREALDDVLDDNAPVVRTTVCGRALALRVGSLGDRLGARRCVDCCVGLDVPGGYGTPANEAAIRQEGWL
ncbi:MAG TPA: hypothetical protein VIS06_13925 [Mycobacteriales bacterium]